ncbi:MAG: methyltransferase domain-containing protein [Pseudomonadota bacterium]
MGIIAFSIGLLCDEECIFSGGVMDKSFASREYLAEQEIHSEWEDDFLNSDLEPFYDEAFARLIKSLGAKPGDRILDAGCGYFFHGSRLARAELQVTGIDFSPAALAAAHAHIAEQELDVELLEGNLLALPFADSSFPYIASWGVLMHIPDLETALSELARVLEPGGRLALGENNSASIHVRVWENMVLGAKRLLGRPIPHRTDTPRGIEEWRDEGLMVRKLDVEWLVAFYRERGLRLVARYPGQFTELYTNLPFRFAKRLVYRFNEHWFRNDYSARLALGNILIFEKEV